MSTRKLIRLPARLSPLLAVALAALPSLAAEGRIPIAAPMVIAASGKYIVTNNLIAAPGAAVITINAPDVDIDLNGFVLTQVAGGIPVISAPAVAIGADHLTIRNGTISGSGLGGVIGIDVPGGAPHRKVVIENVKIKDCGSHGIHLGDVPSATIRNSEITTCGGSGIQWDGPGAGIVKTGTIENNTIRACGTGIFILNSCSSVAILTNRLDQMAGFGIQTLACNGSLISENTVEESRGAQGILLRQSSKNKLYNNVVTLSCLSGIHLDVVSNNNLVLNNNSSGNVFCAGAAADGITDEGTQNVIQGNVLNSNQRFGLLISGVGGAPPVPPAVGPPGCGNTYGRNTARGNGGAGPAPPFGCGALPAGQLPPQLCIGTGAACGVGNTSFGDNLMPGPPAG